jgi:hypothetical protein
LKGGSPERERGKFTKEASQVNSRGGTTSFLAPPRVEFCFEKRCTAQEAVADAMWPYSDQTGFLSRAASVTIA